MSEVKMMVNWLVAPFQGAWMKIWLGLLFLNAGIYFLAQWLMPGNVFIVPAAMVPVILVLYSLWWLLAIKALWAPVLALKKRKLIGAFGRLLFLSLGLVLGGAFAFSQPVIEFSSAVMTFAIGSGLAWMVVGGGRMFLGKS